MRVDVCIIGGGMAGVSLAYRLAPHASVILLEREERLAYHSTGRSAALYAPQYGSRVIRLLTEASGEFFKTPPPGFADGPLVTPRGFMMVGRHEQAAARSHHLEVTAHSRQAVRELSGIEALAQVPTLRSSAVDWALYDDSALDIDVDRLFQGFLRGAKARGVSVRTVAEVSSLSHHAGHWHVQGPALAVEADVIVNAGGAWADSVASLAGLGRLGLIPYRRTAFLFDPPVGTDCRQWPMVVDAEEQFYFKPEAGRLLGSLAEENATTPCDAQPDDLDVATAVDRIEQVLAFPIHRVDTPWTGLRTFGPDRDPVSGFDPRASGFYWHAGLGGYGIQTAPAISDFAASAVLGRSPPESFSATRLVAAELAPDRLIK